MTKYISRIRASKYCWYVKGDALPEEKGVFEFM